MLAIQALLQQVYDVWHAQMAVCRRCDVGCTVRLPLPTSLAWPIAIARAYFRGSPCTTDSRRGRSDSFLGLGLGVTLLPGLFAAQRRLALPGAVGNLHIACSVLASYKEEA